jgi:hypothetical protein
MERGMSQIRVPITKAAALDALDDEELIDGYRDGLHGEPEPGDNRSLSYWHGWRNGMIDSKRLPSDAASMALAKDAVKSGYMQRLFRAPATGSETTADPRPSTEPPTTSDVVPEDAKEGVQHREGSKP